MINFSTPITDFDDAEMNDGIAMASNGGIVVKLTLGRAEQPSRPRFGWTRTVLTSR